MYLSLPFVGRVFPLRISRGLIYLHGDWSQSFLGLPLATGKTLGLGSVPSEKNFSSPSKLEVLAWNVLWAFSHTTRLLGSAAASLRSR